MASLPVSLSLSGGFFIFPVASQATVSWDFSVDAEIVRTLSGPQRTVTTTISGTGSGSITIPCDGQRAVTFNGFPNYGETFVVMRKISHDVNDDDFNKRFRLYCAESAVAGSYSIDTTTATDFEDSNTTDTTTTTTESGDVTVTLELRIDPPGLTTIEQLSVSPISLWRPPSSWSFATSELFEPHTFTLTRTPTQVAQSVGIFGGTATGAGWEQSVTLTVAQF